MLRIGIDAPMPRRGPCAGDAPAHAQSNRPVPSREMPHRNGGGGFDPTQNYTKNSWWSPVIVRDPPCTMNLLSSQVDCLS